MMKEWKGQSEATSMPSRPLLDRRLQGLRERLRRFEIGEQISHDPYPSGLPTLDNALPSGGILPGSIVEWLSSGPGSGVSLLAVAAIREACQRRSGCVVLVDREGVWHPPALVSWGLSLDRLLWIRPRDEAEEYWVIDQALRCPAIVAVWTAIERIEPRWARRFCAAAERASTLGIFERPLAAASCPSWADLQLMAHPRPSDARWRFEIEVIRGRGQVRGMRLQVEVDSLDGALREAVNVGEWEKSNRRLHDWLQNPNRILSKTSSTGDLVSRLARSASRRCSAGA